MFDPVRSSLLDTFGGATDADVVASIGVAAREENAACARRLEAMGELYARRAPEDDDERTSWLVDGYQSLVAEVAAELCISRGRAQGQLRYAIHMRDKLPRLMAVFVSGAIDMRMVITIVNRIALVTEPELLAPLDLALAKWAPKWMRLSGPKLETRIDWWVERFDPAGRRVTCPQPQDRHVEFGAPDNGYMGIEAVLHATDGAALETRLEALAATVCSDDPRTKQQRIADATGALVAGHTVMKCECGAPDCDAAQRPTATSVVIHVLAEQGTVDGTSDTPGFLRGLGPLPAAAVQNLAATANLKPLTIPDPAAPAENGYRPSAALAAFVRARDMTCRAPGCEVPAEFCDIDHTVPYARGGSTHPSNLKCLCRNNHLLKTFWTGSGGWADEQQPDGTVVWRTPSGRTYTTKPGGAEFFTALGADTGQAPTRKTSGEPSEWRGVMMPRRRRTRAQERDARITAERRINEQRLQRQREIDDELKKRREALAANDPPPF